MAPKKSKKSGKGKTSSVVDGVSTEEMSKDQLEEHIIRLREELDREREERSYFQLERDKIQAFWEVSKRNLEETEAQLRNRSREREEAEERHRVEITVYKQKLKRVLAEHHASSCQVKMEAVASSSLTQDQSRRSELRQRRDLGGVQSEFREKKLHNDASIRELKLKHQVELMELTNQYQSRITEMEVRSQQQLQSLQEAGERRRRLEVEEVEERMRSRVEALVEDQDRALRGAEEYFSGVQAKLMSDQKLLKEELAEAQKRQSRAEKELSAAQKENQRLTEALNEARLQLPRLQRRLQEHEEAKARAVVSRAQVKLIEKELRDLTVEQELLLDAFNKMERERDELLRRQTDAILDVQQRSSMKELVLERKMEALSQTLERKEAQLCAALSASNVDPALGSSASNRLEEILESKQRTIAVLQEDVARQREEYDRMLHTCKERLKSTGAPLHHFRPSEQILNSATPP
ncbi:dynein regulatory complex subunit 4-like isoform X2 [Mugil cephalus]|uniref:dynein regulatory complex subunit 4-like isoform X1 n=1 Tax=Mugil cephalus TaxID=48193 RepID=UPI001FB74E6B|nr:dynein regulatory complex subunit 4-like isoform X1 [Mugil cephalus]XP_047433967.1 dynein regulatory complex subunit 4-like isoform X2 [Mugil cephalus]